MYHEFGSHSNESKEKAMRQKVYAPEDIDKIIATMIDPDIVEDVSSGDKLDQRNTVAFAKYIDGEMIVVSAIGGKRNPNIVPEEILWFTEEKWNENETNGLTIKEMIYGKKTDSKEDTAGD